MKTRHLMVVIFFALFTFGGSFTCKTTSSSDGFTEEPPRPAK